MQELIGLICMWFVCVKQNHGITHFDSFGVAYNPKEIMRFIGDKNVTTNISRCFSTLLRGGRG